MKFDKKSICLMVGLVVIGPVIGTLAFVHLLSPMFRGKPSIVSVSSPVSLAEARKELGIPLPDGASNILYAGYAEHVAYEFMLKFEAPEAVCKTYAMKLLEEERARTEDSAILIELRELTTPPNPIPPTPPLNVDWFDVHNIKRGYVAGGGGSHRPAVWIDSDRNLFYYMYTD